MSDDESTRPIDLDALGATHVSDLDEAPTAAGLPRLDEGEMPASATRIDVAAPAAVAGPPRKTSHAARPAASRRPKAPPPDPKLAEDDLARTEEHPAFDPLTDVRSPAPTIADAEDASQPPAVAAEVDRPPPPSSPSVVELDSEDLESVGEIDDLAVTGESPRELPKFKLGESKTAAAAAPSDAEAHADEVIDAELVDVYQPSTESFTQVGPRRSAASGSIRPHSAPSGSIRPQSSASGSIRARSSASGSIRPPAPTSVRPPPLPPPVPSYAEPDAEEKRLEAEHRYDALVELYRRRLARVEAPGARAALLYRMAGVLDERLDRPDEAYGALLQAFELRPRDENVVTSLERIARRLGRLGEVAEHAIKQLHATDAATRVALLGHVVYWFERSLGRGSEVGRFVSELERLDKLHPVVLKRHAQVAASKGDVRTQRDLLLQALGRTVRRDEKVQLYLALASAYAGTPDAAKHYESAFEADPTSMVALQGLERLGREQEKHAQVEWALERQIDIAPTTSEKVNARLKLAELQETKFLRRERAAELLERVLDDEPSNPTALQGLERCYHALREWANLARILRLRAENTYDKKAKIDLYQTAADVHESKLGDVDAAISAYRDLLMADPTNRRALTDLARLSEKAGDWAGVATYKAKLAELAPTKREASKLFVQLGELLANPDRDPSAAKTQYERAIAADPTNAAAWEALQKVAAAAGDERRVLSCLIERARHTDAGRQRALVLVELGALYEKRGDAHKARGAYESAFAADSSNEIAAAAMLDAYTSEERWRDAAPLCELLVNAAARDKQQDALFTRLRLQTRISAALGDADKAMTAALGALETRPDDPDAQADLLAVCSQVRAVEAVIARAKPALEKLAGAELAVDARMRLAEIQRDTGDIDGAALTLERVLRIEPDNPDVQKQLADAYLAQGDFPRACKLIVEIARNATSAEQKIKLLMEAGEIWAKRAGEPEKAASVFEEARRVYPRDPRLLDALKELYEQLGDWPRLSSVLESVVGIQDTPERKAKSLFSLAQLVGDKLRDARRAADLFDQVLDIDRKRLDAFEALVRLLTEAKAWDQLERSYRKMIARIKEDDEPRLRFALFQQLGLVYRDRLGDAARAYEALEAAARLRPEDEEVRKIVTELLIVTDNLDQAVARTREFIARDPQNATLYAELYDLFLRQHSFDKAWCAVNVLARLREELTPEQRQFLADYPPMPLGEVPGQIVEPAWRSHILHPDLHPTLTSLFAIMTPAVARMRDAQLRPEQRVGRPFTPAHSRLFEPIHQTFANAAEILALRPPELLLADHGATAPLAPALAPYGAVLVSPAAVEACVDSLAFVIGKRLAEQRPELSARAFFPSIPDLTGLLAAAIRVSKKEGAKDAAGAQLDASLAAMMTPDELAGLRAIVLHATMEGAVVDVKRWLQAADLSSMRAGLLVCGDVETARKAIASEAVSAGDLPPRERISELYKFAVSDLYADLRGAIGIAVQA